MSARTVLVTGGSRGIGAGIVAALSDAGWNVLAPKRSELDLASPVSIADYLDSLSVPVDGLVLDAGINTPAPIGELTMASWQEIQGVNVTAGFALVSALVPSMAECGFGRVVAVSSAYAGRARVGRAAYSASKAALEAVVRAIAVEFASSGVLANAVAPGFVDTELTRQNNPPEAIAKILERVPVGRLAAIDEIGAAVAFLMSPANTYITGQVLTVDGGFSCT